MKKKIRLVLLLFSVTYSVILFSCKKEDKNSESKTKTELLTAGTWKYTAAIISPAYDYYGDGNSITDIFAIMMPCEKDDFEVYKTSGTWEYNEGTTKCDPSSPQIFSEQWRFAENESKLFVGTVECSVLELTADTLKLQYSFEDAGEIYTETDTYSH